MVPLDPWHIADLNRGAHPCFGPFLREYAELFSASFPISWLLRPPPVRVRLQGAAQFATNLPRAIDIFDNLNDLGLLVCRESHPDVARSVRMIHAVHFNVQSLANDSRITECLGTPLLSQLLAALERLLGRVAPLRSIPITIHAQPVTDGDEELSGSSALQFINMAGEIVHALHRDLQHATLADIYKEVSVVVMPIRIAWDANAYSIEEFIAYYGEEAGQRLWHKAPAPQHLDLLTPAGYLLEPRTPLKVLLREAPEIQ